MLGDFNTEINMFVMNMFAKFPEAKYVCIDCRIGRVNLATFIIVT